MTDAPRSLVDDLLEDALEQENHYPDKPSVRERIVLIRLAADRIEALEREVAELKHAMVQDASRLNGLTEALHQAHTTFAAESDTFAATLTLARAQVREQAAKLLEAIHGDSNLADRIRAMPLEG